MSAVHDVIANDASSTQELLERARALKPLLARNAAQAEDERRIPEENVAALDEAGLFKITMPSVSAVTRSRSRRSSRCRRSWPRRARRPRGS